MKYKIKYDESNVKEILEQLYAEGKTWSYGNKSFIPDYEGVIFVYSEESALGGTLSYCHHIESYPDYPERKVLHTLEPMPEPKDIEVSLTDTIYATYSRLGVTKEFYLMPINNNEALLVTNSRKGGRANRWNDNTVKLEGAKAKLSEVIEAAGKRLTDFVVG